MEVKPTATIELTAHSLKFEDVIEKQEEKLSPQTKIERLNVFNSLTKQQQSHPERVPFNHDKAGLDK